MVSVKSSLVAAEERITEIYAPRVKKAPPSAFLCIERLKPKREVRSDQQVRHHGKTELHLSVGIPIVWL